MSITYTADVFCENCGDWTEGVSSSFKNKPLATAARKEAKRKGWKVSPRGDFCPKCAKEIEEREL